MGRKSTVDMLPALLRREVGKLRTHGHTISAIAEHLRKLGEPLSRSAVGRWTLQIDQAADRIKRSRDLADAMITRLGEGDEAKATRLNVELVHAMIHEIALAMEAGGKPLTAQDANALAAALRNLSVATKADAETIVRVRATALKDQKKQQGDALTAASAEGQLDPEVVAQTRAILGLDP